MTTLFDQYGKQIQTGKPILQEVAVQTIRDRYSSYPSQGLTPERLAAILKEADQGYVLRQAELFEEMEEKDAHLGSVLQTRKRAVSGLEWETLPASDSPEDKRIADAGREMLEYFEDFDDFLFDMLDAVGKGFSVQEIMWAVSEGQVWIEAANWIHQKRFTFSGPPQTIGNNTMQPLLEMPRLLTDAEPIYGENLLQNKFVFHRHKTRSGTTARAGIIRACAYMYLFKNYSLKDWLVFNDLFSVPMRVGKYKAGASPADIEALKEAVFNLGVDAAAVISDSTIIELLEAATRTNADGLQALPEYCDRSMSKAVLGHAGSADSTPGKLGSETSANDVRQDIVEADAKPVSRTVRLQLLAPWVIYNFGPKANVPKFKLLAEEGEDLKAKADTYNVLISAGFDQIPVSHIQEEFSIPKPVNGEATVKPLQAASPFGGFPSPTPPSSGGATPAEASPSAEKKGSDFVAPAAVLNGAQVTAATAIVQAVAAGSIPRDSGVGQIMVLFNLTNEQAEQIMGSAGKPGAKTTPVINPAAPADQPFKNKAGIKFHPDFQLMLNAAGPDAAWIAEYMKRLEPVLHGANKSAIAKIEKWLAEQSAAPSSTEFNAKIQELLGSAYKNIDPKAVNEAVADMYRYYKSSLSLVDAQTVFGGADTRAINWLSDVDRMFYSKFVSSPDSEAALTEFLSERYLKGGEGLFGRGNPAAVEELTNLLSQKVGEISQFQVNRIVDTSVQRIRNFAHINKVAEAGIQEIEIYEPTEECPFCVAMNGKVIKVATAFNKMTELSGMEPGDYADYLKNNPALSENVRDFAARGELPPYHPHCRGRFIVRG